MLSLIVLLPLVVAGVLALGARVDAHWARRVWLATALVDLALVLVVWALYDAPAPGGLRFEEQVPWIPGVSSSYHVGVDGLSLPLVVMTNVVFLACAVHAQRETDRPRVLGALFCFLQSVSLGLFVAADLLVFFVFFDLSIVAMYFVIAGWGHGEQAARSALKFFLYTFLGSLALLAGFIGLFAAAAPHTFDMVELARSAPLRGSPVAGGFVLGAILLGLAVKTPTFPFHTWLPPAHTDAPALGSAVLAGVLLKMGTYGFVRIAMPMLPEAWRSWAWVVVAVGVVSVLYGALVAMAQRDLKRMVAYTSVNHMGYVVMAVGVAGLVAGSDAQARQLAVTGAVTQMVSHGLVTGALFLLVGTFWDRAGSYDLDAYGGLAARAPRLATLFAVGVFASLGLPALSGFVAEFQVFTGSIATAPVTAVALLGIVLVAALLLRAVQQVFTGPTTGLSTGFTDLRGPEVWASGLLLALSLAIGVYPRPLLDLIEPAAGYVTSVVGDVSPSAR